MKIVVQRVSSAWVDVDGERIARIDRGLAVLVGVGKTDSRREARYLAEKVAGLRIFEDDAGKMNLSVKDVGGEALVVSQFTLLANWKKGRRPGFDAAAAPDLAEELYMDFAAALAEQEVKVQTGQFQAHMMFGLINDGPVTIVMDTEQSE